jgi:hypothetical protein
MWGSERKGETRSKHTKDDVLLERNNAVKGSSTEKTDEVAADREEDEGDVDMKNESGGAGDDVSDLRKSTVRKRADGEERSE